MRFTPAHCLPVLCLAYAAACTPAARPSRIPPAPITLHWPDPTFLPERQCAGDVNAEDLAFYLPRAQLALWLPNTSAVRADSNARCIDVITKDIGSGRLAELVLRGAAVPRQTVLLTTLAMERAAGRR